MSRTKAMKATFLLFSFLYLATNISRVHSSADVMKKMFVGFTKAVDECKNELGLHENVMADFFNYWKEDYSLLNRDFGCAIVCLSKKLNMMDVDGTLRHGSAGEFAKEHGADDEMATKIITIVHDCDDNTIQDDCIRAFELAKCFRTKIHGLKWTPNMYIAFEEVFTEV